MRITLAHLAAAIARHWGWLMAALALAVLVGGNYYMAAQRPKPAAQEAVRLLQPNDPAILKLAAEANALEKAYQAGVGAAAPDPAAVAALTQAVQKQRQLTGLLASTDSRQLDRLAQLESELAGAHAQENVSRIDQLAREGQQALAAGHLPEADPKLHEALRLQHEVNASPAPSRYKNTARESDLQQAVAVVETEPLHRELEDLLAAARAAAQQHQPSAAHADFVKARSLQGRINRDHPTSPYANVAAENDINAEIETVAAEDLRAQSEAAEQAGDQAMAAGHTPEAAAAYGQARARQLEINDKYKLSRVVSEERAATLETKRQTAASIPTAELLAGQEQTIIDLLRRRLPAEATPKISEAARTMGKLASTFPASRRLDPALKTRLDYLASRGDRLPEIQRLVFDNLLPVPGTPGHLLLKTEVTQTLYQLVTSAGPSRNAGPGLPVDSVSWLDAQAFCTRLSWLLGRPARLPDEAEFRAALGPNTGAGVWGHENSPDTTQPAGRQTPNAAGFFDLLGNVAEWLAADDAAAEATVAGGSYLDPRSALLQVPVEPRAKNDRGRHIGFRFVVEESPSAPAAPVNATTAP